MKVQDLRIDNWIWHKRQQKAVQVKQIMGSGERMTIWFNENFTQKGSYWSDSKQYEGIDLTTELLEDYGFYDRTIDKEWVLQVQIFNEDTDDEQGVRLVWDNVDKDFNIEFHARSEDKDFFEDSHFMITPVKELHELQNLYYSLTGKELEMIVKK